MLFKVEFISHLLVAVVVELVVTAEGNQSSKTNSKGPVDLGSRINPYLQKDKSGDHYH